MKSGLYSATAGMMTSLERLNIISNNLANVNTSGFKSDSPFEQTIRFYQEGPHPAKDQPVIGGSLPDLGNGPIRTTGRNLDLALEGSGFFAISGPGQKELLTRKGSFHISSDRRLVTSEGFEVLDKFDKPIRVVDDDFYFTPKGDIMAKGEYLTTLKVVDLTDNKTVTKVGDSFFTMVEGTALPAQHQDPSMVIGALEGANTELIKEIANMITVQRSFEFQQRALETILTQTLQKTINELPRPV
jgi:flagellar basal body rod protein FlgG